MHPSHLAPMHRNSAPLSLAVLVVIVLPIVAAEPAAGPFVPDVHTLFLAHFEQLERADYALGQSLYCGNGARTTDGYFGRGIDLQARGLWPDFQTTCPNFTPRFDGWGFHARGNVDPYQGTFECWLRVGDPKRPKAGYTNATFLNSELQRAVPHPEKPNELYASFSLLLNSWSARWSFPTVAGKCFLGEVVFSKLKGFERKLDPADWHHFALTWSQSEMVLWLDGRLLASFDMTCQLGLILLDNPTRFLSMADCIVDELRISNTVRYAKEFEPGWRDGRRPVYAFPGTPNAKRYPPKLLEAPVAQVAAACRSAPGGYLSLGGYRLLFDSENGTLAGLEVPSSDGRTTRGAVEGLMLHAGVDRRRLVARHMDGFRQTADELRYRQLFDESIEAAQRIRAQRGALYWEIWLTNRGSKEAWLEAVLGIPCPLAEVKEFFDGIEPRQEIRLPRHRDEYCLTLPFAAAAGRGRFVGVGIDPHADLSDLVSEWIPPQGSGALDVGLPNDRNRRSPAPCLPSAVIRQGTKLVLSPGESFTLPFVVVAGTGDFETLDAMAAFHDCFPDLYRLRPDVPVYSYMPATQDEAGDVTADLKRAGYAGGIWGHGPGHDKGDEFGRPEWWDNPQFYKYREYQGYTRRIEALWQTLAALRENITYYYRQSFDNWYPVRRFHTCPDLTPTYIIESLWPGHVPNEDPLCFGQYYVPITHWRIVNEYHTPIGASFQQTTRDYFRQTQGLCPGFINDMSHAGALYRHNDPIAQRTPGRSFARDLGPFVRKALGRKQRYEVLNSFVDNGHRASFWSDGGAFSYTLCAYSAAIAIEGADIYKDLTGTGNYVVPARHLLGEKPLSAMTHINDDITGRYLAPEEFSPQTLRDYYRFCDRQLTLFCLRHGVALDPTSYMFGRQVSLERAGLLVESTALGRKVVPAARVRGPLWVVRSGEGLQTLLVVGNTTPIEQESAVEVLRRYFPSAPLFAPYEGGTVEQTISPEHTVIEGGKIARREVAAYKAIALCEAAEEAHVTVHLEGDGITLLAKLEWRGAGSKLAQRRLWLSDFGPLYAIEEVHCDGNPLPLALDGTVIVPADTKRLEWTCRNRAVAFSAIDWKAVELLQDGQANFCLAADRGTEYAIPQGTASKRMFQIGFERGTAAMLNDFLVQYDDEDGVPGNLAPAPFVDQKPEGDVRWLVRLHEVPELSVGRTRIDVPTREIIVEGPTQGEIRRAMVVLLRLVDRKYPHVGRFFPLNRARARYVPGKPVPLDKWVERKQTRDFFAKLSDPLFLVRPILREEYERLYSNGNMDFAGKYALRWPAYVFEPTYRDDFVYGYRGPGAAPPREELHRVPRLKESKAAK